eukprot:Sspe_Gene.49366::Locus_26552_Transcript_1_10_Confidence_0.111_Length_1933::g.49366::m.49366
MMLKQCRFCGWGRRAMHDREEGQEDSPRHVRIVPGVVLAGGEGREHLLYKGVQALEDLVELHQPEPTLGVRVQHPQHFPAARLLQRVQRHLAAALELLPLPHRRGRGARPPFARGWGHHPRGGRPVPVRPFLVPFPLFLLQPRIPSPLLIGEICFHDREAKALGFALKEVPEVPGVPGEEVLGVDGDGHALRVLSQDLCEVLGERGFELVPQVEEVEKALVPHQRLLRGQEEFPDVQEPPPELQILLQAVLPALLQLLPLQSVLHLAHERDPVLDPPVEVELMLSQELQRRAQAGELHIVLYLDVPPNAVRPWGDVEAEHLCVVDLPLRIPREAGQPDLHDEEVLLAHQLARRFPRLSSRCPAPVTELGSFDELFTAHPALPRGKDTPKHCLAQLVVPLLHRLQHSRPMLFLAVQPRELAVEGYHSGRVNRRFDKRLQLLEVLLVHPFGEGRRGGGLLKGIFFFCGFSFLF